MTIRFLLTTSLGLVIVSCSPPAVVPIDIDKIILITDSSSYLATDVDGDGPIEGVYSFTLTARIENQSARAIYLERCYPDTPTPTYGVGTVSSTEESAYGTFWSCVGHDKQFVLKPGESRADTYTVQGPTGNINEPLTLEGQFFLVYRASACKGDGRCSHTENTFVQSNTFDVRLSR